MDRKLLFARRPIKHARTALLAVSMVTFAQAAEMTLQSASADDPFSAGYADRVSYERWFAGLSGDFHDGAAFWAAHRSDRPQPSCPAASSSSSAYINGCRAAKDRLDPTDIRRKSEPQYKAGWNSYAEVPAPSQAVSAPQGNAPPQTSVSEGATVGAPDGKLNLREAASADANVIVELPNNSKVRILGSVDNGWKKVAVVKLGDTGRAPVQGLEGYVNGRYLIGDSLAVMPAFREGRADRKTLEAWIQSLSGNYRAGADFWAAHRSDSSLPNCQSAGDADFRSGCEIAKRRLTDSDTRRLQEPAYKAGWNSPLDATSLDTFGASSTIGAAATPSPPVIQTTKPYTDWKLGTTRLDKDYYPSAASTFFPNVSSPVDATFICTKNDLYIFFASAPFARTRSGGLFGNMLFIEVEVDDKPRAVYPASARDIGDGKEEIGIKMEVGKFFPSQNVNFLLPVNDSVRSKASVSPQDNSFRSFFDNCKRSAASPLGHELD